MNWQKLQNLGTQSIQRGAVLRFPVGALIPEEAKELLLVEAYDKTKSLSLVITSGQKAGLVLIELPSQASSLDTNARGHVSADWLCENWQRWVWPNCKGEDVLVCLDGYPVPNLEQKIS